MTDALGSPSRQPGRMVLMELIFRGLGSLPDDHSQAAHHPGAGCFFEWQGAAAERA
jgi:hypothetical protein